MENLFTWCAVIGGMIFAVQFLLLIVGFDDGGDFDIPDFDLDVDVPELDAPDQMASLRDVDVDIDPHSIVDADGWFVGIVTFRSLVAAITVFGFTGLGAIQQFPPAKAFLIASLAGGSMLYLVGWMFKKLYQLKSDGTVKMRDAIGTTGTVYLTIPANHSAVGKVTVNVAGRTMEYPAMTPGDEIKTGTPIVVSRLISQETIEVLPQIETKEIEKVAAPTEIEV